MRIVIRTKKPLKKLLSAVCARKYQKSIKIQLFNLRLTRDIVICVAHGVCERQEVVHVIIERATCLQN